MFIIESHDPMQTAGQWTVTPIKQTIRLSNRDPDPVKESITQMITFTIIYLHLMATEFFWICAQKKNCACAVRQQGQKDGMKVSCRPTKRQRKEKNLSNKVTFRFTKDRNN